MDSHEILKIEQEYLAPGISEEARLAQVVFDKAEGSTLYDTEGKSYLDFSAGIFTQTVGHNHPYVVQKTKAQLEKLWNIHDFSTRPRAELCLKLSQNFPEYLNQYAFFTTGAEAVEAAIRAVLSSAPPEKNRLAALRYGFHGKTQGARSLVHWDVGYSNFSGNSILGYAANCYRCPLGRTYPSCDIQCAKLVNKHISSKDNIAALFFEPVQGAAGVIVPPKEYWSMISQACQDKGILLVADEIITAGGRTGHFLACDYYGLKPDLVTAAKGLSSGFPFAVLAGKKEILAQGEFAEAGASSSTFGGNPLSCTAAAATLDVINTEAVIAGVQQKAAQLEEGLRGLKAEHKSIGDIRGLGLLWAIEFVSCQQKKTPDNDAARRFYQNALKAGVRTCLGGNIIRLGPPLTIESAEIEAALAIFDHCLKGRT